MSFLEKVAKKLKKDKVEKGQVRNTVLRKIKELKQIAKVLEQSIKIKEEELPEYKGTPKAKQLKKQIKIMLNGLIYVQESIKRLEGYREVTTS